MQEGNRLSFGADARRLVNETDACGAAAIERFREVVYEEADVMDARAASLHETVDRGSGFARFEQLDEGVARSKAGDRGTVGIVEVDFGETEHVPIQRTELVERPNGDANVCDARWGGSTRLAGHVT